MNEASEPARLYIVGAGVAFPDHLTVQTIDILTRCARICTNLQDERLAALPPDLRAKCISLWPLYQDGRRRRDNYRDVTNAILSETERVHPTAWITPGHPMIFDSVSKSLLEQSAARHWKVSVAPAISCLDTLLAEVGYDPASGLAIHDATGLVRRNIPLVPSIALVLLQISVFMSDRAHLSLGEGAPDLGPLRDYLQRYFGARQRCAVVRSSSIVSKPPEITWIAIDDLPALPADVLAGGTLFVPPILRAAREPKDGPPSDLPER